jgi:hypothetical protein
MSAVAAIVTKLEATAGVTDLCSTRIYSVAAPDGASAPYVVFQQIAASPGVSHGEASGATERMFQIACFAASPKAARALRDAVIAALDGEELSNGDNPTLEDERDSEKDDAANLYRADADFLV